MIKTISVGPAEKAKLTRHIDLFAGRKVLILGDIGLDEYILGEVHRISPEAPVPVLEVENQDLRLGLGANVAQNVVSLGGTPYLISLIGNDTGGEMLSDLLKKHRINTDHLVMDATRPTTRKARVMAKHHHLVRIDFELKKSISLESERRVLAKVSACLDEVDAIILQDYGKGVLTASLLSQLIPLAHAKNKKLLVDPTRTQNLDFYKGVDLIKPNFDESLALTGIGHVEIREKPDKIIQVGEILKQKTSAREVVVTMGKDGMMIFGEKEIARVPTFARQVFDVTGAGDTVIATIGLGVAAGLPLTETCMLANFAAGVVVGQVGCVPCTVQELKDYIQTSH